MIDPKKSEKSRNEHLAAIQKSRNDMSRLMRAEDGVVADESLTDEDRQDLLNICGKHAAHIFDIMRTWEA